MSSKAERAEATRARLLKVARGLFAGRGYAAVGTEEIVRTAGVTRGALYHHFRDKQDLFRAVVEEIEQELVTAVAARLEGLTDPTKLLATGLRAFLDACTDPAVTQIVLLDAPTALGWQAWRELDARFGLGLVTFALENALGPALLRRVDVRPLAQLVLAALGEAALLIAHAPDRAAARKAVEPAMRALLEGLRLAPTRRRR